MRESSTTLPQGVGLRMPRPDFRVKWNKVQWISAHQICFKAIFISRVFSNFLALGWVLGRLRRTSDRYETMYLHLKYGEDLQDRLMKHLTGHSSMGEKIYIMEEAFKYLPSISQ
jgi:hypothetical protein